MDSWSGPHEDIFVLWLDCGQLVWLKLGHFRGIFTFSSSRKKAKTDIWRRPIFGRSWSVYGLYKVICIVCHLYVFVIGAKSLKYLNSEFYNCAKECRLRIFSVSDNYCYRKKGMAGWLHRTLPSGVAAFLRLANKSVGAFIDHWLEARTQIACYHRPVVIHNTTSASTLKKNKKR